MARLWTGWKKSATNNTASHDPNGEESVFLGFDRVRSRTGPNRFTDPASLTTRSTCKKIRIHDVKLGPPSGR